jgi:hypothetical protein
MNPKRFDLAVGFHILPLLLSTTCSKYVNSMFWSTCTLISSHHSSYSDPSIVATTAATITALKDFGQSLFHHHHRRATTSTAVLPPLSLRQHHKCCIATATATAIAAPWSTFDNALMDSWQDNSTSQIYNNLSDNSNSMIAPIRENRRMIDNSTTEGGDWENHPRGEYVLLCHRHLATVEAVVDSFDHLSNNLLHDSPSDQLETQVRTAFQQSLKLYYSISDILTLYINPDYPCPEDYIRFNQEQERTDGRYRPTIRQGIKVPSSAPVSPSHLRNNQE